MIVGFLRRSSHPPKISYYLSLTCAYYGIKLVYFTPKDISIDNKTITGKILMNNKWEEVTISIPKFIDITPHLFNSKKHSQKIGFLKNETMLSIDRRHIINKDILQTEFMKIPHLQRYAIKGEHLKSVEQALSFISENKKVVAKPIGGLQGKSVIMIEKASNNNYKLGINKEIIDLNEQEFIRYVKDELLEKGILIQTYVSSRTIQGEPFDCRVHLEKKSQFEWVIAKTFIRVGVGQTIVSNISQGGGISKTENFLKANFGEKYIDILDDIKKSSKLIAEELEKITDTTLMTIGLDIGINEDGSLFVFEANSFPIVAPSMAEISVIRPLFYKSMLTNNSSNLRASKIKKQNHKIKKLE